MKKRCRACNQVKDASGFYRQKAAKDGLQSYCIVCQKEKARVKNSSEEGRARNRAYYKRPDVQARLTARKETKTVKDTVRRATSNYRQRHRERSRARGAVNDATRAGKMVSARELPCAHRGRNCAGQARQYHHHKGYARKHWYDVIAVCLPCHRELEGHG